MSRVRNPGSPIVEPYGNARRPSRGSRSNVATSRAVASAGNECWSTKPAAREINPGVARAICIKELIAGGVVRCDAALRLIRGVMMRVLTRDGADREGVSCYSSDPRFDVKFGK